MYREKHLKKCGDKSYHKPLGSKVGHKFFLDFPMRVYTGKCLREISSHLNHFFG